MGPAHVSRVGLSILSQVDLADLAAGDEDQYIATAVKLAGDRERLRALRSTLRRERYGTTYLEFNSLPFSPGKRVSGQIQLRLPTSIPHGVDLQLSCVRRIITGSGKEQTTNEIVLWQGEANVPQSASGHIAPSTSTSSCSSH